MPIPPFISRKSQQIRLTYALLSLPLVYWKVAVFVGQFCVSMILLLVTIIDNSCEHLRGWFEKRLLFLVSVYVALKWH